MMNFEPILNLAQKHFFFAHSNKASNVGGAISYWYGHMGCLLLENIKSEWLYSNVINRDISVSLFKQKDLERFEETQMYNITRDYNHKQLPFGIAQIFSENTQRDVNSSLPDMYFNPYTKTYLQSQTYISPSDGQHFFMNWQRKRKLWWKKMSCSPGRFTLGDIHTEGSQDVHVHILAKYPWGEHIVETISTLQLANTTLFHAQFGPKDVTPTIISSKMALETALVSLFCDAFHETDEKKPILRFHRKISPYKCALVTIHASSTKEMKKEMSMLAYNLSKLLRRNGISTEYLKNTSTSPETQFERNDEIGIPYTIILDSASLKTGVMNIRDRDTTLNEQVHISNLPKYMKQLIKNF